MGNGDSIVTFGSAREWSRVLSFVTGALRRRWYVVAFLALLFTGAGVGAAILLPRVYSSEARMLVRKNYLMPALAHPKRAVPMGTDTPGQSASEFVLRRDSLLKVTREAKLLALWRSERPRWFLLKDRVVEKLKGPISESEREEALVDMLEKKIRVSLQDEVLTIRVTWSTPDTAVLLANKAVDAFLEARRRQDVQTIADTCEILARSVDEERVRVEERFALLAAARKGEVKPLRHEALEAPDGLDGLRTQIFDARRQVRELEHQRSLKIAEMEARLAAQQAVMTDAHPNVEATREAIERMQGQSEEVERVRTSQSALLEEYVAQGGDLDKLSAESGARLRKGEGRPEDGIEALAARSHENDEATGYARSLLRISVDSYEDLTSRLGNTRIELATAKAAFAYRYQLTQPPRRPRKPDAPKVPFIVAGGLLGGLLAGALAAVFLEARRNDLLSWTALAGRLSSDPKTATA